MNPTPRATVIEFFYPGGFAYDYEWTTRALNMVHYGFWGSECVENPSVRLHLLTGFMSATECSQVPNYHQVRQLSRLKTIYSHISHILLVGYPLGVNGDGGFQGNSIPADGRKVAELIHWRLSLAEEGDD